MIERVRVPRIVRYCLALSALNFIIFLPALSFAPIASSSEAREAHLIRIIYESGEWILPSRAGVVPSKPPLFHWIGATLAHAFLGVNHVVVRLPSLLAGSAAIFIVSILAATCLGFSKRDQMLAAFLAAVVLSTTYGFFNLLNDARVDMVFALFVMAAIGSLILVARERLRETLGCLLFGLSCGLAVLAKGPLGIVLPVAVGGALLWNQRGYRFCLKYILSPWTWIPCLSVCVPWYLLAINRGGERFINRQIWFENVARFVGGVEVNSEVWWFYLPSFLIKALPWSVLFIVSLTIGQQAVKRDIRRVLNMGAVWAGVGVILFSLASGKRHSYLLPIFPALALTLSVYGTATWRALERENTAKSYSESLTKLLRPALQVTLIFLTISLFLLDSFQVITNLFSGYKLEVLMTVAERASRLEILLILTMLFIILVRREIALWVGVLTMLSVWSSVGEGIKNGLKGFKQMAFSIDGAVPAGHTVYIVREEGDEHFDPLLFYLKHPAQFLSRDNDREVTYFLARATYLKNSPGRELGRYMPIQDRYSGRTDREIVLVAQSY